MRCYHIIAEPANKATMLGIPKVLSLIHNVHYRKGVSSIIILEEKFRMVSMGMAFKDHSPFYKVVNDKIRQMLAGGLINYWIEANANFKGTLKTENDIGPQVLTMDHLEIGFKVCAIPLVLSTFAFIGEILTKNVHQWYQNFTSIFKRRLKF